MTRKRKSHLWAHEHLTVFTHIKHFFLNQLVKKFTPSETSFVQNSRKRTSCMSSRRMQDNHTHCRMHHGRVAASLVLLQNKKGR